MLGPIQRGDGVHGSGGAHVRVLEPRQNPDDAAERLRLARGARSVRERVDPIERRRPGPLVPVVARGYQSERGRYDAEALRVLRADTGRYAWAGNGALRRCDAASQRTRRIGRIRGVSYFAHFSGVHCARTLCGGGWGFGRMAPGFFSRSCASEMRHASVGMRASTARTTASTVADRPTRTRITHTGLPMARPISSSLRLSASGSYEACSRSSTSRTTHALWKYHAKSGRSLVP